MTMPIDRTRAPRPSDLPAAISSRATLTTILADRANTMPDALSYAFRPDGLNETARLTWAQLHERTLALAAILAARVPTGSRVMLLVAPGLENVIATQACFAARMVGVPVAPPNPRRAALGMAGLQRVAVDAGVRAVLTTSDLAATLRPQLSAAPALSLHPWIFVDEAPTSAPSTTLPASEPTELAYLQYTSGSTSDPRGVMLTHAQFMHNLAIMRECWQMHARDVSYTWLPPWHDMGLVAGLFCGIYEGIPTHIAPPNAIARRPHHWLQSISDLRVTVSGAPDFMYRASAALATPEFLAGLDLSAWRRACSGSEPVRASTLRAFSEAFASTGFDTNALAPSYGMAESTLAVTTNPAGDPLRLETFDRAALAAGEAQIVATGAPDGVEMVGNGRAGTGQEIAIVDPVTHRRLADGQVGEVWTRGASVGLGYWLRAEETERTFGGEIDGEPGIRWLRSGDVAFISEGHLFIAGRMKDVIILNGVKRHAVDIELAAQESHPALATRAAAVFSVDDGTAERVVVVLEAPKDPLTDEQAGALLAAVRRAVATNFEVQPTRVALVSTGSIPKTTSGKVQRGATRAGLAAGEIPIAWEWNATRGKAA